MSFHTEPPPIVTSSDVLTLGLNGHQALAAAVVWLAVIEQGPAWLTTPHATTFTALLDIPETRLSGFASRTPRLPVRGPHPKSSTSARAARL